MPDRLTLEQAKARMEHIRRVAIEYNDLPRINCATDCIDILSRVHVPEPDEEGQAVLWLMREKKKSICITDYGWEWQQFDDEGEWYPFDPIEEAKKLGWGGGE